MSANNYDDHGAGEAAILQLIRQLVARLSETNETLERPWDFSPHARKVILDDNDAVLKQARERLGVGKESAT